MNKNTIVFLDFDGVVNTPIWSNYKTNKGNNVFCCRYAWPEDGYVNNYQAICWLNHLYTAVEFDIVVVSSWREDLGLEGCISCLRKGGLNEEIDIIGILDPGSKRQTLIKKWIEKNDFIGTYIVFDDEPYYYTPSFLKERVVLTNASIGINEKEIIDAKKKLKNLANYPFTMDVDIDDFG